MSVALLQSRPHARLQNRRTGRRSAVLLALSVLVSLLLAAPAQAGIGETIVLRCTHHESIGGYTQSDYRKALNSLEADAEEYSDCAQVIREAQLAAAGGGLGGGGTGQGGTPVATTATPAQERALAQAARARPQAVALGGRSIHPGVVHVDVASALSALPTPLLSTLAFVLACLLLCGGGALHKRFRGRAH
ncbi:MAG TPA: hypothetical protein VGY13_08015 [Solirubrobacteraceae bacterium]|jgi:hypothetical protein|nr:hypothetical protein [Solirubrobacteraceae bacterium]